MANDFVRFARSVEYSTGKKRGRRPVFNANRFYPHALERELSSLAKSELERFLSECTEAALVGIPVRDDMEELSKVPETLPEGFVAGVEGVAERMRRKASTDFAEWSEMVVGKPYYPPEAEREIFSTWTANFQTLCKSAEADAKKDISLLVSSAKNEGWNRGRLEKSIRERLPSKYRARAENIARTELGKLNSAAKLSQFREVGISYYRWLTTIDGRERDSHRSMNGLICSVSNPGVYYTENPDDPLHPVEHPRTAGMFHGNPGEDFQCRCSMVAWDPEIDGMYEVREAPEPERKPSELETAREEAEKARGELEEARKREKKAAEALKKAKETAFKAEAERIAAEKVAEKALEEARRSRLEAAAVKRHATRTTEKENEIAQRRTDRIERTKKYSSLIGLASGIGVSSNPVKRLVGHLSSDAIVSRLAGGDLTKGSCSSLAIAYAANRKGLDVLDFRGGESLRVFSLMENIMRLAEVGGYVMQDYNGYTLAHRLISLVQPGKEYYFTSGAHAAIVRKSGTVYEFLELQDPETARNGFKPLTVEQLKSRFGTKKSWTVDESKLMFTEVLVDIDKMTDSPKFKELVGFINTEAGKQQKGATGNTK